MFGVSQPVCLCCTPCLCLSACVLYTMFGVPQPACLCAVHHGWCLSACVSVCCTPCLVSQPACLCAVHHVWCLSACVSCAVHHVWCPSACVSGCSTYTVFFMSQPMCLCAVHHVFCVSANVYVCFTPCFFVSQPMCMCVSLSQCACLLYTMFCLSLSQPVRLCAPGVQPGQVQHAGVSSAGLSLLSGSFGPLCFQCHFLLLFFFVSSLTSACTLSHGGHVLVSLKDREKNESG